jgi:hypothetical protein
VKPERAAALAWGIWGAAPAIPLSIAAAGWMTGDQDLVKLESVCVVVIFASFMVASTWSILMSKPEPKLLHAPADLDPIYWGLKPVKHISREEALTLWPSDKVAVEVEGQQEAIRGLKPGRAYDMGVVRHLLDHADDYRQPDGTLLIPVEFAESGQVLDGGESEVQRELPDIGYIQQVLGQQEPRLTCHDCGRDLEKE